MMIDTTLYVSEGPVSRTVRVRATTLVRALEIAGANRLGVSVELTAPVTPVTIAGVDATLPTALPPQILTARAA